MNKSSAQKNIESLTIIAHRLGNLCDEVTFVGGCVTGLLITDKAAPDVRFTVDVDCIINVITRTGYYALAEKLCQKGFKELMFGNHPICRWDCDGILVDVMPVDESVDFLLSHDLEDIISLVDGRSEIVEDVSQASQSVRQYLSQEFAQLMNNENFLQALPGHLNYSNEIFVREKIVKERINAIIDLDL
ncbi:hypothetical protein [Legionella impletisoli]|uniref:Uncharacterized protein n=1 Tax=Legionella impletisoli TaxID=343510 RepID=A0A917JVE7_9GAMM|nr:hypothetical protein [Legionella impletisoli]GGI87844.1 hypothetical protein GCM10007966_15740 [Legionella impletisoli]